MIKTNIIYGLGLMYFERGLLDDAGRVLELLTRAVPNLRLLDNEFCNSVILAGYTMKILEKQSEAREFWIEAARLVNQNTPAGKAEVNLFKLHIALCCVYEGKLEEAGTELASIDIPSLLHHSAGDYRTMEEYVDDVLRVGLLAEKKEKAMEALQGLMAALETASTEDGRQLIYESLGISKSLLAHGMLVECEAFIRQRLSHLPSPKTSNTLDDEASAKELFARGIWLTLSACKGDPMPTKCIWLPFR